MATGVLNILGQTVLPSVFRSLTTAGIADTMTIQAETAATIGTGGGRIKGTVSEPYQQIPVAYEPTNVAHRIYVAGDKSISSQQYTLTFPTHANGCRIEIDPKTHRLVVNERGHEPLKTFRILAIQDISGVVFEAVCEREG